jgi:hypothetical protein
LQEELEGVVRDAVLRVIQGKVHRLDRHALAARRIFHEELAEVYVPDLLMMGCEGLPGRAYGAQ